MSYDYHWCQSSDFDPLTIQIERHARWILATLIEEPVADSVCLQVDFMVDNDLRERFIDMFDPVIESIQQQLEKAGNK